MEKFRHAGARSPDNNSYLRNAKCIYSGNTRTYEVNCSGWNGEQQMNLNAEFMNFGCSCARCIEQREHRKRLRMALEECGDIEGLKAMGFY